MLGFSEIEMAIVDPNLWTLNKSLTLNPRMRVTMIILLHRTPNSQLISYIYNNNEFIFHQ